VTVARPGPATVEPAVPGDADQIADLVRSGFDVGRRRFLPFAGTRGAALLRAELHEGRTGRVVVVTRDPCDGAVTAFARWEAPSPGTAHLSYLCVSPEARGRGLGRLLLVELLSSPAGRERVTLDVFRDNVTARRLYASAGFVPTGATTTWYARGLPPAATGTDGHPGPDGLHRTCPGARATSERVVRVAHLSCLVDGAHLAAVRTVRPDAHTAWAIAPGGPRDDLEQHVVAVSDRWALDRTAATPHGDEDRRTLLPTSSAPFQETP